MSYLDTSYLNMPSIWRDMFEDKKVVDSLLESSIDMIADSYSEILRSAINKSIYSDKQLKKTAASAILLRLDDSVNVVDQNGQVLQSIIPVETTCVSFSYIGNSSTIDASTTILSSSIARLVSASSEVTAIQKRHSNHPYLAEYNKFLVLKGTTLLPSSTSLVGSYSELQARVVNLPKQAKYNESLQSLVSGELEELEIAITEVGKSLSLQIKVVSEYVNIAAATPSIVLPPKNRISNSGYVEVTIGGYKYNSEITTISTDISENVIYGINAYEDELDMYSKLAFHSIGSAITTTDHSSNLALALSKVTMEGFTSKNVLRLLNTLSGSPLITYGAENSEVVLNFSTKLNRVVSTLCVYDVPLKLRVSLDVIDSCHSIDTIPSTNFLVIKDTSIKLSGISILERVKSLDSQTYVTVTQGNTDIDLDIVYIGRDYLLLKKRINVPQQESSIVELKITTGSDSYTVPIQGILREPLVSDSLLLQKDSLTSYFSFSNSLDHTLAAEIGSVYIPEKLYKTVSPRRLVSSKEYKLQIGAMPVHLVGDYGLFVSDDQNKLVKSAAYYLYRDFYFRNSAYVHITYKDYLEGIGIDTILSVLDSMKPSWCTLLYGSSFSLTEYVAYTNLITDFVEPKISLAVADSKQLVVSDTQKISELLNVKYLTVRLAETALYQPNSVVYLICASGGIQCSYLGDVDNGYIALRPLQEYIYQELLNPVSVDGNEILDFDIQGVVGHSNSTAGGDATAVIGSALPYTESIDKYSGISDEPGVITITSRGPQIKVIPQ